MPHFQGVSESWAGFQPLELVDFRQFNLDLRGRGRPKRYLGTQVEIAPLRLKLGGGQSPAGMVSLLPQQ